MKDNNKQAAWWQPALIMFGKISVWVVVPILGSLFLGRYLDNHFGTKPILFIATTILALTVSVIAIARICLQYIRDIEEEQKDKKDESTNNTK